MSIITFLAFDEIGTSLIPYIAAWRQRQKAMWYEYVGKNLLQMLACQAEEAADHFKESILEQRKYKHQPTKQRVVENIASPDVLAGSRSDYRREARKKGVMEAVYKCKTAKGKVIWLKDHALIEAYVKDRVYLSLGYLTNVTKEMEADEARKRMESALRKSEERFRHQAIHDNLTGLYNTRYLYNELDRLIDHCRSHRGCFSLIFLDIDNFKAVVDAHGHLNASQAIREIGASIRASLKKPAFGVAYGGDEFIVVLPDFNKEQAMEMAEHIRSLMRQTVYLTNRGLSVKLQASFGVASFPDDADDQIALIGLADRAMFGVKAEGKNAVRDINTLASK